MKKIIILLTSLMLVYFVHAEQWLDAKITLRNGNVLTGLATMPNDPADIPIHFKENKKAKSQAMHYNDIVNVIYILSPEKSLQYDVVFTELGCCGVPHEEKWLKLESKGAVTLYSYVYLDVTGSLNNKIRKMTTYWLCLRPGEETAIVIASSDRKNKKDNFSKMASEYFNDDPELIAKINAGEYKWSDVSKIVDEYNAWKGSHP